MCLHGFARERIARASGTEERKKKEVSSNRDSGFTKDIIRANSPNQVNAARREFPELSLEQRIDTHTCISADLPCSHDHICICASE